MPASVHPALQQSLFIAGTDTGVGKTWVAVQLLRALATSGVRSAGMKPVAAGAAQTVQGLRNEDAEALQAAGNTQLPYEWVNPCCLPAATSPHLAAEWVHRPIRLDVIKSAFDSISAQTDLIVVESAGGWLAPIGPPELPGQVGPTMQEVAVLLNLPVVLVVGIRLGCLSHALLTTEAIQRAGLRLAGWVANPIDPAFADVAPYLESLRMRIAAPLLWDTREFPLQLGAG